MRISRTLQMAVGYTGTVTFSTTDLDPGVVLPADYTFTATDAGTQTFTLTLITPGPVTLSVTDGTLIGYLDQTVS
jgi:hypothetical protein